LIATPCRKAAMGIITTDDGKEHAETINADLLAFFRS
jgi:hypothetical protein